MNLWKWLTTPDPTPGYTPNKVLRLAIRVMLFAMLATLVSGLLQMTPLAPYLKTWWGSMLLVFALYVPVMRFMAVDTFETGPRRASGGTPGQNAVPVADLRVRPTAAKRRQEKNRYAGVKKRPPSYGGRR